MAKFIQLFLCLMLYGATIQAQNIDIDVLKNINQNRNQKLDNTFKILSNSIYPVSLATPISLFGVGLIKKDNSLKREALASFGSLMVSGGIAYSMKKIINRDRPYITYPFIYPVVEESSKAFPSGHATLAFATATSLSLACRKWYVTAPAFVWASGVAYSRLHLGVHYPSDILAGAIIGAGTSYIAFKANRWLQKNNKNNKKLLK